MLRTNVLHQECQKYGNEFERLRRIDIIQNF